MTKIIVLDLIKKFLEENGSTSFEEIMNQVQASYPKSIDDAFKAEIFTSLNIESDFIHLGENIWDLRIKHSYAKVHLPINEIYKQQKIKEDETKVKLDSEIKEFVENEK